MREFKSRISHPVSRFFHLGFRLLPVFVVLLFLTLWLPTCGKKAAPLPPIPIVPQEPASAKVLQGGSIFIYSLQLPALNTDYKTPVEVTKIEVFRLKDPRFASATQTQPQTQTQTRPQSQPTAQTRPQTKPAQTQSQPQSQTQSQTQTRSTQSQTQSQPAREEQPRQVTDVEFKDRSEKIAEIPKDQVDAYLRDNYFLFTDKFNSGTGSEDYKYWFYYALKIYNKKGKTGGFSNPVAMFPALVPTAPKGFIGVISEKKITLSWNPVTKDISGKPLTASDVNYNIYRGTSANFAPVQPLNSSPLSTTTFDDATFQFGQTYYYFVRARSASSTKEQESDPSNAILIFPQDTFPPTAPQELTVVAAKEGMVLIWAPNPEEDVAGYNIYRSNQSGSGYQKINKELVRETTYTDPDIQPLQKYYYVITAVDNAPIPNESPKSTEVSEIKRHQ